VSAALDAANHVRRQRATIRHRIREHGRREAWRIIRHYITEQPDDLATMDVCDLMTANMWVPESRVHDIVDAAGIQLVKIGELTHAEIGLLAAAIDAELARKSPLDMED
jgi:hypothetical protein